MQKGDSHYIRGLNDQLVMDLIFREAKMSRAEISRLTKLSKPTVSSSVQRLLDRGWVREVGRGENTQGRKATMLEFYHSAYFVCGIDLGAAEVRIALARPDGSLLEMDEFMMPKLAPDAILTLLLNRTEQLLKRQGVDWERNHCIAIGAPGIVVPETGSATLLVTDLLPLEQALSLQALEKVFPVKVLMENDVNLATMAEQTGGIAVGNRLFAYLSIGAGVGAGLVIEGRLLRGLGGAAGEIGHMQLGKEERVEDLLSVGGLMRLVNKHLASTNEASLLRESAELSAAFVFEAARKGDWLAKRILESYCELLAMAIHNLSVILSPELIVLGGEIGIHSDVLIPLLQLIADHRFPIRPKLAASLLGEHAVVVGAVNIAAQHAYDQIRNKLAAK